MYLLPGLRLKDLKPRTGEESPAKVEKETNKWVKTEMSNKKNNHKIESSWVS